MIATCFCAHGSVDPLSRPCNPAQIGPWYETETDNLFIYSKNERLILECSTIPGCINLENNEIDYQSTAAGFQPSTLGFNILQKEDGQFF